MRTCPLPLGPLVTVSRLTNQVELLQRVLNRKLTISHQAPEAEKQQLVDKFWQTVTSLLARQLSREAHIANRPIRRERFKRLTHVVPKNGMVISFVAADTLLFAGTVLPNVSGVSLPGLSHCRNSEKGQKRERPFSPTVTIQEVESSSGNAPDPPWEMPPSPPRGAPLNPTRGTKVHAVVVVSPTLVSRSPEVGLGDGTGDAAKASPTGTQRKFQRGTADIILNKKGSKAITKPSHKDSMPQSLLEKQKPLLKREVQERPLSLVCFSWARRTWRQTSNHGPLVGYKSSRDAYVVWSLVADQPNGGRIDSLFVKQALEGEYPKFLRLYLDLCKRLQALSNQSNGQSEVKMIRSTGSTTTETSVFQINREVVVEFENAYLSRSVSRLLDPVHLMFSGETVPTHEEVDSLIRTITSELSVSLVDVSLSRIVARNISKTVRLFCLKCEQMIVTSGEATQVIDSPTPGQILNVSIGNLLHYLNCQVVRVISNMKTSLQQDTSSIVMESLSNTESLTTGIVSTLLASISDGIEAIILTMHNEDYSM
uniref:Uncharacterized protein n=1 Tax=Timema tahoe TaxID=61484 RepID=A0A7R9P031_9NEOP|nr:unnamed protein product [Timema tahoe]